MKIIFSLIAASALFVSASSANAEQFAAVAIDHQNGVFSAETDIVERIGGQEPQSLVEFIRTHVSEFSRGQSSARVA